MVKIKKQLVSSRASTYGNGNAKKYITIHETANTNKGANAQVHANLQSNGYSASWHWSVDDKEAIQSFPHTVRCWHAGNTQGNNESIGIEICVNSDGNFKDAVKNAAALIKKIMKQEGIPLTNVVQHNHWSGKHCPTNLRNGSKGITWNQFKNMISGSGGTTTVKPPKKQTGSTASTSASGRVESKVNGLRFYNKPSWSDKDVVGTVDKGMGFPTIVKKVKVGSAYQYEVKNSKGVTYYITASSKYVSVSGSAPKASKPAIKPKTQSKGTVHLPASSKTWRTYKTNVQPVAKNSDWSLTPSAFGGLTYKIVGRPYTDVVTINTSRGKRNIYVAKSTGAVIK